MYMKYHFFKYILLSILLLLGYSCRNESAKIVDNLIGEWKLDSASTPYGNYYKLGKIEHTTIIFKNQTDYSYDKIHFDVGFTFTGKFFVLYNPKRELKTLTFIPDIQISEKDTSRIEYLNLDIKSIDRNRLVLVDETKWIDRVGLPSLKFNKVYIYKKSR